MNRQLKANKKLKNGGEKSTQDNICSWYQNVIKCKSMPAKPNPSSREVRKMYIVNAGRAVKYFQGNPL